MMKIQCCCGGARCTGHLRAPPRRYPFSGEGGVCAHWAAYFQSSGQWSVASECEADEIAVTEKRQNEANFLGVLIVAILGLRTKKRRIEQEKRSQFPAGGKGRRARSAEGATHSPASARSVCTAAAVASLRARFSHSCGINVSLASLGLCARTCERYHGLFSPGSRPTASSQTLSASPTGLRARWAC